MVIIVENEVPSGVSDGVPPEFRETKMLLFHLFGTVVEWIKPIHDELYNKMAERAFPRPGAKSFVTNQNMFKLAGRWSALLADAAGGNFEPGECALVLARLADLVAARKLGFRTIYVSRFGDETLSEDKEEQERQWVDSKYHVYLWDLCLTASPLLI